MIQIAPSILSADFSRLGEQVAAAQAGGADCIHCDVMDGHFVPNMTIGPLVIEAVRRVTTLPIDVHLMIERPERYIPAFVAAGANSVSVHGETCPHLHRTIQQIVELGARASVAPGLRWSRGIHMLAALGFYLGLLAHAFHVGQVGRFGLHLLVFENRVIKCRRESAERCDLVMQTELEETERGEAHCDTADKQSTDLLIGQLCLEKEDEIHCRRQNT